MLNREKCWVKMEKRLSVAMAVYNGEKYLKEQLESILRQIDFEKDEIVISYNLSVDSTWDMLLKYSQMYACIRVLNCEEKGIQANFNNALNHSQGKYVFLSDQDDVWLDNKIERCLKCFKKEHADLIMHAGYIVDQNLNSNANRTIFHEKKVSRGLLKNAIHCSYHGCCLAMTNEFCRQVLPLPRGPFLHDMWIGEVAELFRKRVVFLNEKCILYRRHGENCSGSKGRTIYQKIRERYYLFVFLIKKYYQEKEF